VKRPSRWKKLLLGLIAVVATAAALLGVLRGRANASADGPTATVSRGTVAIRVEEVGIVEPFRKVELKSKIAGQVAKVLVDVGDRVHAGEVLVELEPRDTRQELRIASARHHVNQVMLDQAGHQLGFKRKAHEQGLLSDLEFTVVAGEVKKLEAQSLVHAAEESQLRDQLESTRLRSPMDGVVLSRNVEPGELVTPGVAAMVDGRPLMIVAQVDRLLVRAELNQLDVARLRGNQEVQVRVDALPGWELRGQVFRVAAMAQKSARRPESQLQVFPVDVVVDAAQPGAGGLKPGMVADLRVDIDAHENVLTLPLEALVYEGKGPQVRKLGQDGKETLEKVELGFQSSTVAEIVSGVAEGDRIRIRPADTTARNKD